MLYRIAFVSMFLSAVAGASKTPPTDSDLMAGYCLGERLSSSSGRRPKG